MNKKAISLFASTAVIALLAGLLFKNIADSQGFVPVDLSQPEAQSLVQVLAQAERLKGTVACDPNVPVYVLGQVMVDTRDAELNDNQRGMIARVFGEAAVEPAGYLTAMKAYYLDLRGDYADPDSTLAFNIRPTPKPMVYCPTPAPEPELDFKSIGINGDKARAQYDNGPALVEAILVRINGQWLIANLKYLQIHF